MTPDMSFECLFVSRDPGLFATVDRLLRDLSISTNICFSSSRAFDMLERGSTDLVVIDWDNDESDELLRRIWSGGKWRKPTIVAISSSDPPVPGAHVFLKKPVTADAGHKSFKDAYSKMLVDYRRHVRHALMLPTVATFEDARVMPVTIVDISSGGVGLSTKKPLAVDDVLSFRFFLPGTQRDIFLTARVLWTREYGRAGCEFVRIPPVDFVILHDWLRAKTRVKTPTTAN
jgi:PilZ domain